MMVFWSDSFSHIAKELSLFHVAVSTFYGSACKVIQLSFIFQAYRGEIKNSVLPIHCPTSSYTIGWGLPRIICLRQYELNH